MKCDYFIDFHKNDLIPKKVDKLLDKVSCEIMETSIRRDFNETR